jgi:DNA-binding transcriptional LysR family regulator
MLNLAGSEGQNLAVTAFPAFATTTLPLVVSAFRQHQPGLHVSLSASNAVERMVDAVANRGVDFAISNVPAHSAGVRAEHLCQYATVCVVRKDHPFARHDHFSLETVIALDPDDDSQLIIDRAFQDLGLDPSPAVEVSHCAAACAWVATAGGCTIVDPFTAGEWAGQLAQINTDPPIWLDLWVLTPSARPMTRVAAACLDELRHHLASLARMVHTDDLALRSTR